MHRLGPVYCSGASQMDGCLWPDKWSTLSVWRPPAVQMSSYCFRKPTGRCNRILPCRSAGPGCEIFCCAAPQTLLRAHEQFECFALSFGPALPSLGVTDKICNRLQQIRQNNRKTQNPSIEEANSWMHLFAPSLANTMQRHESSSAHQRTENSFASVCFWQGELPDWSVFDRGKAGGSGFFRRVCERETSRNQKYQGSSQLLCSRVNGSVSTGETMGR